MLFFLWSAKQFIVKQDFIGTHYVDFKIKPKIIVLHCSNFDHESFGEKSPYELWRDTKFNVGAHYIIQKDGTIIQSVPDTENPLETAYMVRHAGQSNWKGQAKDDHEKHWLTLNYEAIGIEIDSSGFVDPLNGADIPGVYQKVQIDALKWLLNRLKKKYHIKNKDILGHSDISPYRYDLQTGDVILGKNDPSENFPWSKIVSIRASKISLKTQESIVQFLQCQGYDLNRDGKVKPGQEPKVIKYCMLAFARRFYPQYVELMKQWDGENFDVLPNQMFVQKRKRS